jgi:hypothetical protein
MLTFACFFLTFLLSLKYIVGSKDAYLQWVRQIRAFHCRRDQKYIKFKVTGDDQPFFGIIIKKGDI